MLAVAGQEWQLLRLTETTHCCVCQKTSYLFQKAMAWSFITEVQSCVPCEKCDMKSTCDVS